MPGVRSQRVGVGPLTVRRCAADGAISTVGHARTPQPKLGGSVRHHQGWARSRSSRTTLPLPFLDLWRLSPCFRRGPCPATRVGERKDCTSDPRQAVGTKAKSVSRVPARSISGRVSGPMRPSLLLHPQALARWMKRASSSCCALPPCLRRGVPPLSSATVAADRREARPARLRMSSRCHRYLKKHQNTTGGIACR